MLDRLAAFVQPVPAFSVWYPPAALSIVLFLLWGPRFVWLPVAAEALRLLIWPQPTPWYVPLTYIAVVSSVYALAIAAAVRWFNIDPRLTRARDYLVTFVMLCIAAALNSFLTTLVVPPHHPDVTRASTYWVGDISAIVSLVPPFVWVLSGRIPMALARFGIRPYSARPLAEFALVTFLTVALPYVAFVGGTPFTSGHTTIVFPVLLPVMWMSARFAVAGAVWSNFLVGTVFVILLGTRPLTVAAMDLNQMFALTLEVTGLLIGLTSQEQRIASRGGRISERGFATALAASSLVDVRIDEQTRFRSDPSRLLNALGYAEETIDRLDQIALAEDRVPLAEHIARLKTRSSEGEDFELRVVRDDEGISSFSALLLPYAEEGSHEQTYFALLRDVTTERETNERLRVTAFIDPITGLPNRTYLEEHLSSRLSAGDATESWLYYVHFSQLSEMRNAFGPAAFEDALASMSRRLLQVAPQEALVCRVGREDFALLVTDRGRSATEVADEIVERSQAPLEITDAELVLLPNVGIARYPQDVGESGSLLRTAGEAARRSAATGVGRYAIASVTMKDVAERLKTIAQLQRALNDEEFVLHYQPIVSLNGRAGDIVGVEALLRWNHPVRGLLPPGEFLEVLESTRLIDAVGEWVLQHACAEVVDWDKTGHRLELSVNVSVRQIWNARFAQRVKEIVEQAKLDPRRLTVEITESVAASDVTRANEIMSALREGGIRIALDDFGVGNSSLSRLRDMPINVLKIDRSFVSSIAHDARAQGLANAIISLTRGLGLKSVAEGVETLDQLEMLSAYRCDRAQGYYLGRPMPAEQLVELLSRPQNGDAIERRDRRR